MNGYRDTVEPLLWQYILWSFKSGYVYKIRKVFAKVIYTKYSKHSNKTNTFMGLGRAKTALKFKYEIEIG